MKKKITYIFVGLHLYGLYSYAQQDSIQQLNEVFLGGLKFKKNSEGKKSTTITNEQIVRNPTNLTETLRYNSPIAFRDYGNGGVSSARFRGTSPTNTSVLWNGIAVNSVGNGQTDFNAISANTVDEIQIISGGSSAVFGSGAIGGTILLKDILKFKNHHNSQLVTSYGSFNTLSNFIKTSYGTNKWAFKVAATYNRSENDYKFIDTRFKDEDGNLLKNENGNYLNYSIDASLGYPFSKRNQLYFFTTYYYGNRLFSAGLPNPSSGSERNRDFTQRNLLKWNFNFSKFRQSLKLAYLTQEFRYFSNKNSSDFNFGKSERFVTDYSLSYRFSNSFTANFLSVYENTLGKTDQINTKNRQSLALGNSLLYTPNKTLIVVAGFRKEFNSDFSVPTIFSLSGEQKLFKNFKLKANLSTNYRVPTYNELFWPGVGNKNLVPEESKQFDAGFEAKIKKLKISTTYFFINLENKIVWLPSGNSNFWRPINIKGAKNRGVEAALNYQIIFFKNHYFNINSNYTYTSAYNTENKTRLIFVPEHLLNLNIDYTYKSLNFYLQHLYQSKVYTSEANIDFYSLTPVEVTNTGINFQLINKPKNNLNLGFKVNNIFNTIYYFSNLRPMPGRNYNLTINYKF